MITTSKPVDFKLLNSTKSSVGTRFLLFTVGSLEIQSILGETIITNVAIEIDLERAKVLVNALHSATKEVERADSDAP